MDSCFCEPETYGKKYAEKDGKDYNCGECSIGFATICHLYDHLKSHCGLEGSFEFFFSSKTAFPKLKLDGTCFQKDFASPDNDTTHVKTSASLALRHDPTTGKIVMGSSIQHDSVSCHINTEVKTDNNLSKLPADLCDIESSRYPNGSSSAQEIEIKKLRDHTYIVPKCQIQGSVIENNIMTKSKVSSDAENEQPRSLNDNYVVVSEKENEEQVPSDGSQNKKVNDNTDNDSMKVLKGKSPVQIRVMKSTGVGTIEVIEPLPKRRKSGNSLDVHESETDHSDENEVEASNPNPNKQIKERLTDDATLPCTVCKKEISKRKMTRHMKLHNGNDSFMCGICGKMFPLLRQLTRHQRYHTENKLLKCHMCPARFNGKREYTRHVNSHIDYRPCVCNVCDKRFQAERDLNQHQERVHMGIVKYVCEFCDRAFCDGSSFRAHRATHFEPTLQCGFCDRKFRHKNTLVKHERTHSDKKHYQCHLCNRGFNQCTPYFHHMEKTHGLDKTYLKDVMKLVVESLRREGKKLEIYRVPDNIEDIVAKLKREDEGINSEQPQQGQITGAITAVSSSGDEFISNPQIMPAQPVSEIVSSVDPGTMAPPENNVIIYSVNGKMDPDLDLGNCYILLDMKDTGGT